MSRISTTPVHGIAAAVCASLLLAAGCTPGATGRTDPPEGAGSPSRASATVAAAAFVRERAGIVPRIDHHQHLVGPTAVIPPPPELPAVQLPAELDRVVRERNRVMGTAEVGDLYAEDARILDVWEEGHPWVRGRSAVQGVVGAYARGTRFIPNALTVADSVAHMAGVVRSGDSPRIAMNFSLALRKDRGGAWRIVTEHVSEVPPRTFEVPITADRLVRDLDEAGIERAVVLSVAYFFGSPNRTWPGDEYTNVRAENDWVAAQAARYPDRLVPFCGVSPLKDYAVREIRRCREIGMRGLKLHFRSSRVNVLDPEHLRKVREVFRTANELGMPIVVHSENAGTYGREQAEVFLAELLPAAPDVVVQIAHLWGGNQFRPAPLSVFADAVSSGDPRARNLYFDLTEIEPGAGGSAEAMEEIARRLRQIGLERILYGSDAAATPEGMPPALRWARLRHALPLTDAEIRVIAGNAAPYMR